MLFSKEKSINYTNTFQIANKHLRNLINYNSLIIVEYVDIV